MESALGGVHFGTWSETGLAGAEAGPARGPQAPGTRGNFDAGRGPRAPEPPGSGRRGRGDISTPAAGRRPPGPGPRTKVFILGTVPRV